jgi:hypothetical protein
MLTAALLKVSAQPPLRASIVPVARAFPSVFATAVNMLAE